MPANDTVITFLIQLDLNVLLYLLPLALCFSIAFVASWSKNRRPLELLALFICSFILLFLISSAIMTWGLNRPFMLTEVFTFP